ncbi:MAG: hypothetical protein CMF38_05705 [Legionellaceae bacterium]|nr:hypothetical protein [Legionellaceae bacterium]HAF87447.1 hypothetical protein [Legionellales bacterium]HCA89924.1 hypothetical protein [Legionellales bacterium]|tara:strand:+ start:5263 stop:5490 length:228 start_codon:yes stop_codon:yes gene_type:complete
MPLSDYELEMVRLIDTQVALLRQKKATDAVILVTLADFVPEVRCLAQANNQIALELLQQPYPDFYHFFQLLTQFA